MQYVFSQQKSNKLIYNINKHTLQTTNSRFQSIYHKSKNLTKIANKIKTFKSKICLHVSNKNNLRLSVALLLLLTNNHQYFINYY